MKFTPKLSEKNDNVSPESLLKEFFILISGVVGIIVFIYIILGLAVDWVVPHISMDTEQKIAALFSNFTLNSDNTSVRAESLQTLCDKLQKSCVNLPYTVKVFIRENKMATAVALPGGNIIVFSGLIDRMTSENELAFILLHEFGHFANQDHLRGLGRSLVFLTLSAVLFGSDSSVGKVLTNSIGISETGFSRAQEVRADEFGIDMLYCFYGHVNGATNFFKKIAKAENPGIFGQYFSSHPETMKRISLINNYGNKKKFPVNEIKPLPEKLRK